MFLGHSNKGYRLISRCMTFNRNIQTQCYNNNQITSENETNSNSIQNDSDMPRNSDELAIYLSKRIVAASDHFVVLDKPPNLSVFGHSLAKQEILSSIDPKISPLSNLCIYDCLPQLAQLLEAIPENHEPNPVTNSTCLQPVFYRTSKKPKMLSKELPHLSIIEPLPAAYSGLILLGRTSEYTKAGRQFYQTAMQGNPPWALYQQFLALCWGQPTRKCAQTPQFPIASYPLNKHINIGYRPSAEEITRNRMKKGHILYKRVQHALIAQIEPHASLIELKMNSTYRGLPEVYLSLEGCSILGETLQSSRLVRTGQGSMVLHPSQTQLNAPVPSAILQQVNQVNLEAQHMPVHLHRTGLFIPAPTFEPSLKGYIIKPYLKQPHGSLTNLVKSTSQSCSSSTSSSSPATSSSSSSSLTPTTTHEFQKSLSWSQVATDSNSTRFILTSRCLNLPSYFQISLNKLGIDFDYAKWVMTNQMRSNL